MIDSKWGEEERIEAMPFLRFVDFELKIKKEEQAFVVWYFYFIIYII